MTHVSIAHSSLEMHTLALSLSLVPPFLSPPQSQNCRCLASSSILLPLFFPPFSFHLGLISLSFSLSARSP